MKVRAAIAPGLAALWLGCATAQTVLRIDGSPGVQPLVEALAREYGDAHRAVPITFGRGLGSRARIDSLAAGTIDMAMASHGVDTAALRARGIVAHEIARTPVVFAVNAGVPIQGITARQACDILSGRVTSWSELGGPAAPVVAHMRPMDEVDAEVAHEALPCLEEMALARSVAVIARADDMADALAGRANAFGITSMPYVERSAGRIRALVLDGVEPTEANVLSGRYPMQRRAYLLVREPPAPHVARFLDFVHGPEGRRVLLANGAIAVR